MTLILYRLSRARRIIENAFGILVARWRIFKTEINAEPTRVESFTKASVVLHNWLINKQFEQYVPATFADTWSTQRQAWIPGEWRAVAEPMVPIGRRAGRTRAARCAWTLRDQFARFFQNEGAVPWQVARVTYSGVDKDEVE